MGNFDRFRGGGLLCIFITAEVDNFLENKIDPTAIFVGDN